MKLRRHIAIYASLVAGFLWFKLTEHSWDYPLWFHHYFEDLLAMPIFLKTALTILQALHSNWKTITIGKIDLILITALTSIYFEWILPFFDARFTNDSFDLVMYTIGTLFFSALLNKPFLVLKRKENVG